MKALYLLVAVILIMSVFGCTTTGYNKISNKDDLIMPNLVGKELEDIYSFMTKAIILRDCTIILTPMYSEGRFRGVMKQKPAQGTPIKMGDKIEIDIPSRNQSAG